MSLPQSFIKAGFGPPPKRKFRRLMIGTEGESGSGKTEFIASAPGPGIVACIDRNYECMLENPRPPKARNPDFAYKIINLPLDSQETKDGYLKAWKDFKAVVYSALAIPECLTVGIDTDNVSWDLQMLADHGKVMQVPQLMRAGTNTARRAFITKLHDSGKNIIATNMLRDEYIDAVDDEGKPILKDGKKTTQRTGERTRQGFPDQNYLWHVQIRHLTKPATKAKQITVGDKLMTIGKSSPPQFGIKVLKCNRNSEMVGEEIWGDKANFAGLVKLIYPEYPLSDWGF